MKKILMIVIMVTLMFPMAGQAAGPGIIYKADPYCGLWGGACPRTWMMNRTGQKILAVYAPNEINRCDSQSNKVWVMGHPNNAQGVGFSNNDWQDLEVAKQKSGGYYRWGCCFPSDPYNAICLY